MDSFRRIVDIAGCDEPGSCAFLGAHRQSSKGNAPRGGLCFLRPTKDDAWRYTRISLGLLRPPLPPTSRPKSSSFSLRYPASVRLHLGTWILGRRSRSRRKIITTIIRMKTKRRKQKEKGASFYESRTPQEKGGKIEGALERRGTISVMLLHSCDAKLPDHPEPYG